MSAQKFLILALCIGLVGLLIYRFAPVTIEGSAQELLPPPERPRTGPQWMVYNYPWGHNAAIGNVLPSRSMGQQGQVGNRGAFRDFTDNKD